MMKFGGSSPQSIESEINTGIGIFVMHRMHTGIRTEPMKTKCASSTANPSPKTAKGNEYNQLL